MSANHSGAEEGAEATGGAERSQPQKAKQQIPSIQHQHRRQSNPKLQIRKPANPNVSYVSRSMAMPPRRSADLQSISICRDRRRMRRFPGRAGRSRSAGFQTCCVADFQVGSAMECGRPADLEIRDTADLEVCATLVAAAPRCAVSPICNRQSAGKSERVLSGDARAASLRYGRLKICATRCETV